MVMPLSWLGPLMMTKSFKLGGTICCTSFAFSTISFNCAYSSLPITAGVILAVNFIWALL